MPSTSDLVTCPPGQWTSIAQQMDQRTTLIVQCPELASATNYTLQTIPINSNPTLVAANNFRTSFMVAYTGALSLYISTNSTDARNQNGFQLVNTFTTSVYNQPWLFANEWGAWTQQQWFIANPNATPEQVSVWEEISQCRAIILGIVPSNQTVPGPYGNTPIGLWTSSDFAAGPAIFRMNRSQDDDLITKEWFAWPVSSVAVPIQIFQAWTTPPIVDEPGFIQIGLPQLSTAAKRHLRNLRMRINGQKDDTHG